MGISLIVKGADYSAIAIARSFLKLRTTVTDGLISLHQLRDSAERAVINEVGANKAIIVGVPTYTSKEIKTTAGNTLDFNVKPPSSRRTFACILNTLPQTIFPDKSYIGSRSLSEIGLGGDTLLLNNGRIYVYGFTYSNNAGTLSDEQLTTFTSPAIEARASELIVVTLEDEIGITVYVPRTGYKGFMEVGAGRYFATDNPPTYRLGRDNTKGSVDSSLFALWNRALTESEVLRFYSDIKPQMHVSGVDI